VHEGGLIEGRHIELVASRRLVQAWRFCDWEPGIFSLVRLTLSAVTSGTKLVVDQDAYPSGKSPMYPTWHEHLSAGWPMFYFGSLSNYFDG
jgi:activator of HSP90 ATPase